MATKIRTEGFLHPEKKVVMLGIAGFKLTLKPSVFLHLMKLLDWYSVANRNLLTNKTKNNSNKMVSMPLL